MTLADRMKVTSDQLLVGVLVAALVALVALVVAIIGLRTAVEESADRAAEEAGSRAVRESLCALWDAQRVRPGDPEPTTPRGRVLADRARGEYERLDCA